MRLVLFALLLSACSSSPSFRKGEDGYTVHNSDHSEIFDVRAQLPESTAPELRVAYLTRAGGEECLRRGSNFFDAGMLGPSSARVVCYKRPTKRSLGVVLDPKSAKAVTVQDTVANSHAPFRPRDVVRKIGGVEVDSVGALKEQIFRLAESGRKEVNVAVERSGIALSLQAPFSEEREAVLTPEALEELRKRVP